MGRNGSPLRVVMERVLVARAERNKYSKSKQIGMKQVYRRRGQAARFGRGCTRPTATYHHGNMEKKNDVCTGAKPFSMSHLHSRFEPSSIPGCVTHPGNSQGRNSHRRGLKQYDRHRFLVALRLISKVSRKSDKRQEKHLLVSESLLCVGKFTELVANHVLSDHHRDIVLPVVHQKSDTVDI